ncbi:hypothetical protein LX32DRAFT_47809 [Colletotrichum zoysiae]|uniref:Uncharacterized protein n=1 Tax=Colletotrichum zoysiae TaxID=1216348 RepID=A0AAD9HB47_9PEZI|nr:hypothetical protein LX32DRAFT_47809 [Colletotrichum zoysiae]
MDGPERGEGGPSLFASRPAPDVEMRPSIGAADPTPGIPGSSTTLSTRSWTFGRWDARDGAVSTRIALEVSVRARAWRGFSHLEAAVERGSPPRSESMRCSSEADRKKPSQFLFWNFIFLDGPNVIPPIPSRGYGKWVASCTWHRYLGSYRADRH